MSTKFYLINSLAAAGVLIASGLFLNSEETAVYQPKKSVVFEQAIGQYDIAIAYNRLLKGDPVTGDINPKDVYAARNSVKSFTSRSNKAEPMGLTWRHIGPSNVGGRTRAVAVDRANINTLVAGSVAGGVYVSTNGGDSWFPKMLDNNNLIAAISQAADGAYYIGTGPALDDWSGSSSPSSHVADNILGDGIYRMKDIYGEYEQILDAENDASFRRINQIVNHPTDPNVMYVATFSGGLNITRNATAAEPTFENANGLSAARVVDVDLSPDGNTVLAVSGSNGGSAEVWRSTDGGNNFSKVLTVTGGVRGECAISPTDGNYAYLSVTNQVSGGCLHSIWQSSDGGETWDIIAEGDPAGGTNNTFDPFANPGTNCQGQYDNAIAVFPDNPGKILIGGVQLWQGIQQPNSDPPLFGWSQVAVTQPGGPQSVSPAYVHADVHRIVIPSANTVYIGSDGGIGRSRTAGRTWSQNNFGNHTSQFYSLAISPQTDPNVEAVMGGTQDNGTLIVGFPIQGFSNSSTEAFEVQGGDGFDAEISKISTTSFATSQNGSLRRYDGSNLNSGEFFDAELSGICENNCGEFYTVTELWESNNASVTFDSVMYYADTNYSAGDSVTYPSKTTGSTGGYPITDALPRGLTTGDSVLMPDRVQSQFAFANLQSATGVGIYLTRDATRLSATVPNWSKVVGQESYPDAFGANERTFQIQFSNDGDHMFFGTTGGALYRLSNLNYAYDSLTSDIRSASCVLTLTRIDNAVGGVITGIAIDPNDDDNLIVTIGGYGRTQSVFRITNATTALSNQANTTPINGDLPSVPVYDAEIDVMDRDVVLIGTQFGVFATKNAFSASPSQVEWTEENFGMPRIPVYEVKQQTDKTAYNYESRAFVTTLNYQAYYIGTHGGGFFKTESLVGIDDIKGKKAVSESSLKIYPNPVRANSILEFDLSKSTQGRIRIFDLKGQLVQDMNMGNLPAGKQRITLPTQNLSVGTYIVNVTAGEMNEVIKIIKSE